jgi:cyclopropane-fatty-acyl-phospholipid synthase
MSQTATLSAVNRSFYERAVLDLLMRMKRGRLELIMPDGEDITIGDGTGGIHARAEITDPDFFRRCLLYGDIGFGEAYVDGLWNTPDITAVISWMLLNIDNAPTVSGSSAKGTILNVLRFWNLITHRRRANSRSGSQRNISEHYDLSNAFFSAWLDPSMTYSSAFFENEDMSLEEAQQAKYRRLSTMLHLHPEHHVLEIGSGWGGNAIFMATNFGCKVTSITISKEQQKFAQQRIKAAGLEDRIEIVLEDYRNISGSFDRIVSIEMLEAVGAEFFEPYFAQCHKLLKPDGLLALQVITCPDSRFEELRKGVDWIQKHIFPGSLLPSLGAMNTAINRTGDLTLLDVKDLGQHYAKTLSHWRTNFNTAQNEIKPLGFDDRFARKWNYYLCYCEAAFKMRNINVLQLLYSRPNNLSY